MEADDAVELLRNDGSKLQLGDRIAMDDSFGTVKFIGCVPPTKGLWLGVDWDDENRGKHDGSHEGVRYFQAQHPTSGSFVRPRKVDLGKSFLQALQDRYGLHPNGLGSMDKGELIVRGTGSKVTVVEIVGAEKLTQKQSKFDKLNEVSVCGQNVYGIRSDCLLSQITPSIIELDLSRNLLASWNMVAHMCQQLSHLHSLNISGNKLPDPVDSQKHSSAFLKVHILIMNKMGLLWDQILQCSVVFPCLTNLYVCKNNIKSLSEPLGCLQNITMLTLRANGISSWEEILKLGKLKKLEKLIISENFIEKIYLPDVHWGQKSNLFINLKQLSFTGENVKEWSTFDELNKLQNLEILTCGNVPSLGELDNVRETVIAKIANLTTMNHTLVTEQERRGAEIDYLKHYGQEWLRVGGNQDPAKNNPSSEFLCQHPRFQEIVNKWGAPEDSELTQQSKCLKDNLITLKIICSQLPGAEPLEKKLPVTMTVQKLRTLIQRICHLDKDFTLSYISQKMAGPEIVFDNELRQLSFYSVESGDTVQVKW